MLKYARHVLTPPLQSIKNNIASTELTTEPDRILCMQKVGQPTLAVVVPLETLGAAVLVVQAQAIMEAHAEQRRQEKTEFPGTWERELYLAQFL